MKFQSAILFCTVSLGAAAPFSDVERDTFSAPVLHKRTAPSSSCGLDNYPGVRTKPVKEFIEYLTGPYASPAYYELGECTMIECIEGTSLYLCVYREDGSQYGSMNPALLGRNLNDTWWDCFESAPSGDKNAGAPAMQYFGDTYNLLLAGRGDCKNLGTALFPSR